MSDLTLQFVCADCGKPLEVDHDYPGIIKVSLCKTCGSKVEYGRGYQDGYQMGLEDGEE